MKLYALIFSLFCLQSGLQAAPSEDPWNVFQDKILQEQTSFSGWCPRDKAKHIMNLVYKNPSEVCVELGVYGGSSFFPLAAVLDFKNQGVAYAIDPWENSPCLEGYEQNEKFDHFWGKIDLNKTLYKFIEDMHRNHLDAVYAILRRTSAQAFHYFADASIDFLHIDGNHSEEAALFDVKHWLPKVKKGGIICFDDAWWKSTQPAIQLLLQEADIMEESSPKWQYIFVRKR